jgi:hypothetical protein
MPRLRRQNEEVEGGKQMYTGRLIDELILSVQRAEEDAHIHRDEEMIEQFLHAQMLDASYTPEYVGVN